MFQQYTRYNFTNDAHQAHLLTMCRLNYGSGLYPIQVKLTRPKPPDTGPWIEVFGDSVKFDRDEVSLDFSDEQADMPLTGSNSELAILHDQAIKKYLLKLGRNNILNRSRMCIMDQLPSGRITEDDLACTLNMSTRTLHRKLRENDMTFRSLLEQVRVDLSKSYIRSHNYHITEIAFLLGYSDTSAFSRAFKNWFGHSPTEARAQTRAS